MTGDGGVGTSYSVRRGPTSARTTIIVAEAPSRYVSRTHALLGLRFDLEARLTPERGGTYLALEARTERPRGLRWFGRVVEAFVLSPREAERELANLKAIIEADQLFGDLYKVLQVDPEAEREVIRAAYRALALKYHPDVSSRSQDRMAALNYAWGILRNAAPRADYDQARAEAQRKPEVPKPEASVEMRTPMPARPPGTPSGSVLDFGRYAGWPLGQIATVDAVYLEWLARTPIGRPTTR